MNPVNNTTTFTVTPSTVCRKQGSLYIQGPVLVGPESTVVDCPFCHASVRTAVLYTNNSGTHMAAGIYGRICCCFCIPYMSDSAKNADHYCPNCEKYLGTYRRF